MAKDSLARGARSAQFFNAGKSGDKVELKNLSKEPRLKDPVIEPVKYVTKKWRPIFKQILVRPQAVEAVTQGGILLSEGAKDRPMEGTVVRASSRAEEVTDGDVIAFGKYTGTEIKVGAEMLLLMSEEDILAVLEG